MLSHAAPTSLFSCYRLFLCIYYSYCTVSAQGFCRQTKLAGDAPRRCAPINDSDDSSQCFPGVPLRPPRRLASGCAQTGRG